MVDSLLAAGLIAIRGEAYSIEKARQGVLGTGVGTSWPYPYHRWRTRWCH